MIRNFNKCINIAQQHMFISLQVRVLHNRQIEAPALAPDDIDTIDYLTFKSDKVPRRQSTIIKLKQLLDSTDAGAIALIRKVNTLTSMPPDKLSDVITLLCKSGISKEFIHKNPFILTLKTKELKDKITLLKIIKPRRFNDLAPFLFLKFDEILRIRHLLLTEESVVPGGNRIYYFSDATDLDPQFVSHYFIKRTFMFDMNFTHMQAVLNFLLEAGVKPLPILKDLWVFRYSLRLVKLKINRAKHAQSRLMPWMVRFPEEKFRRLLHRTVTCRTLLGDNTSLNGYLSKRLGCSEKVAEYITSKHPSVLKVRVIKVKEILDYLFSEGFTSHHISQVPRILCHSLSTTKERLTQLRALGHNPSSLSVVCKSKKEYEKFVKTLSAKNKRDDQNELKNDQPDKSDAAGSKT